MTAPRPTPTPAERARVMRSPGIGRSLGGRVADARGYAGKSPRDLARRTAARTVVSSETGGTGTTGAITFGVRPQQTAGPTTVDVGITTQSSGTYSPPTFVMSMPPCILDRVQIAVDGSSAAQYQLEIDRFKFGSPFNTGGVDGVLDASDTMYFPSQRRVLMQLYDTSDGSARLQFVTSAGLPDMNPFTVTRYDGTSTAYPLIKTWYRPIDISVVS